MNSRVLILLLFSAVLSAQTNVGRISGTVQDSSGAVIPDSALTVTNPATGFKLGGKTDASGSFVLPSVPSGS